MARKRRSGGSDGRSSSSPSKQRQRQRQPLQPKTHQHDDDNEKTKPKKKTTHLMHKFPWFRWIVLLVTVCTVLLGCTIRYLNSGNESDAEEKKEMKTDEPSQRESNDSDAKKKKTDKPRGDYAVLDVIPHDESAFTQGLTCFDGKLYESTGLNGQSQVRHLNRTDGAVLQSVALEYRHFGEGLSHFRDADGHDRLILLTWTTGTGFIYDAQTFEVMKEFPFQTHTNQGWGITYDTDRNEFAVSDGSEYLYFWDRDTLQEKRRIPVTYINTNRDPPQTQYVQRINELEYVDDRILANLWYLDLIVSIVPETGIVEQVYDFSDLYVNRTKEADCFNGISVSDKEGELFVTGKRWPNMYRVKLLK